MGREIRADPHTGKVRVIYAGKIIGSPFPVLSIEPSLSSTAVIANTRTARPEVIQRSLRHYFPRTYSRYLEHDVMVLCGAHVTCFRAEHSYWFKEGVLEGGKVVGSIRPTGIIPQLYRDLEESRIPVDMSIFRREDPEDRKRAV